MYFLLTGRLIQDSTDLIPHISYSEEHIEYQTSGAWEVTLKTFQSTVKLYHKVLFIIHLN
jgi:hypothetical protein